MSSTVYFPTFQKLLTILHAWLCASFGEGMLVSYHDGSDNNCAVLHARSVIRKQWRVLDQYQFVSIVPVANLQGKHDMRFHPKVYCMLPCAQTVPLFWRGTTELLLLTNGMQQHREKPWLFLPSSILWSSVYSAWFQEIVWLWAPTQFESVKDYISQMSESQFDCSRSDW